MSENVANKISNHKHDVFISYSTKNKNVADAIVADFEQHTDWFDPTADVWHGIVENYFEDYEF